MSLKKAGMLRMDEQRARSREVESERGSRRFSRPAKKSTFLAKTGSRSMPGWRWGCANSSPCSKAAGHAVRLRRYLEKMTGRSRASVPRLLARDQAQGRGEAVSYRRQRFAQRYPWADIELLAAVDQAHDTLSGPATRRILRR